MLSNSARFIISNLRSNPNDWEHSHSYRHVMENIKLGIQVWDYRELLTCKIKWKDDEVVFNFLDALCISFWAEIKSTQKRARIREKNRADEKKINDDVRTQFDFFILEQQRRY